MTLAQGARLCGPRECGGDCGPGGLPVPAPHNLLLMNEPRYLLAAVAEP